MAQYIDKSALVAEIERLINCCYKICAGNLDFLQKSYPEHYYSIETYKEILSFLNTLEVKEVDLEKEIGEYLSTYWPEKKELHPFLGHTAKQFFKLGMAASNKAQKGE